MTETRQDNLSYISDYNCMNLYEKKTKTIQCNKQ